MANVDGRQTSSARLFEPPARWGYEYVEPPPAAPSPARGKPPERSQVREIPRSQATGLRTAAISAAAGTVGVLVLDSELGVFSFGGAKGAATTIALILVNLLAAILAFWVARVWRRSASAVEPGEELGAVQQKLLPAVIALASFLLPYIVLPIETFVAWRQIWLEGASLVPHPQEARQAETDYQKQVAAWQHDILTFEAAQKDRVEATDLWYPVPLSPAVRTTCIFGGTADSWKAVLATVGASLLGCGERVVVGDLSRRHATDTLCDLCASAGVAVDETTFPGGAVAAELSGDLSWSELSTVLAEVMYPQRDPGASRQSRQDDRSIILEVAECLDADGAVSVGRMRSALLVVLGREHAHGEHRFEPAERGHLTALSKRVRQERGGELERILRIERALRTLEALDRHEPRDDDRARGVRLPRFDPAGGVATDAPIAEGRRERLTVIRVDKQAADLEYEWLVDLLIQLLIRRVQRGWAQTDVLAILGADDISANKLESLLTQAEQERIRVLLFFKRLREDAIAIMGAGGGGSTTAFLTLGDHREADAASQFIGTKPEWVLAQQTRAEGESHTSTTGQAETTSVTGTIGLPFSSSIGLSRATGRSSGESVGQSSEHTLGEQLMHVPAVRPDVLMGLPTASMIYVEVLAGRRTTTNIDCGPRLAGEPRVAVQPRAAATDGSTSQE